MKSQILLFLQQVLTDVGTWCNVSTTRDFKTISDRVEHEGLSYLMITLPEFGKEFEKALAQGQVSAEMFVGYGKMKLPTDDAYLPAFLGGFLSLVFNPFDGTLRDLPDLFAIRAIRQITLMFAKVKLPTSEKRTQEALDRYVACDVELRKWKNNSFLDETKYFQSTSLVFERLPLHYGWISSLTSTKMYMIGISSLSMVQELPLNISRETVNMIKRSGLSD